MMHGRSWMAAWVLAAASIGVAGWAAPSLAGPPAPVKQQIKLNVHIAGTTPDSGVELVIKPGHPACKFKPITYKVRHDALIEDIPPIEVETPGANRDCSFAIVLKEPGQPDKLIRRTVQVDQAAEAAGKPQVLKCFISSNAVTSKVAGPAATPVAAKPSPAPATKR